MIPQIQKINQLRAKADSLLENRTQASSEAFENIKREARALLAMAAKLQAKHHITDAQLNPTVEETIGGLTFTVPQSLQQTSRGLWFEMLCQAVGETCDVKLVGSKFHGNKVSVVGNEVDTQLAHSLLIELCDKLVLFFEALRAIKELEKWEYCKGFAYAVLHDAQNSKVNKNSADSEKSQIAELSAKPDALMHINGLAVREKKLAKIAKVLKDAGATKAESKVWSDASESFQEGLHDGLTKDKVRL